jgi:hypothetical protein
VARPTARAQSTADEQPSSLQLALRTLQLNREPTLRAQAGNMFRGMAAPIVLPTAAAHTAFETLVRAVPGRPEPGRLDSVRSSAPAPWQAEPALEDQPLAIEDAPPPRRRLRGKQPRP